MNAQLIVKAGTIGITKLVGGSVIQTAVDKALRKINALKDTPRLNELFENWSKMTRKEKLQQTAKFVGVSAVAAFVGAAVIAVVVDAIDEAWVVGDDNDVFVSDIDETVEEIEEM